jgi:hypothetical protein
MRFRPRSRRACSTWRPVRVDIRARKPWTRMRRRFLGCHVRFGMVLLLRCYNSEIIPRLSVRVKPLTLPGCHVIVWQVVVW